MIDAPRVPLPAAAILAARSTMTLIVLQLTVKDVRVAREMMNVLAARGVPQSRMVPLVNRYRKTRRMITIEEGTKALGVQPLVFSNDFKSAVQAFDYGQLLAKAARRSILRRDIQDLAARVTKEHAAKGAVNE